MGVKRPSGRFSKPKFRQIEGRNPVLEAFRAKTPIDFLYLEEGLHLDDRLSEVYRLAAKQKTQIEKLSAKRLRQMSKTGGHHQGVIAHAEPWHSENFKIYFDQLLKKKDKPFFLILPEILYEHNLGAVLRSAEAAGVDGVILSNRGLPISPVVCKTAVGAEEHLPIFYENIFSTIKLLKNKAIKIYGLEEGDHKRIYNAKFEYGTALIIGAEDHGITETVAQHIDEFVSIPMLGNIGSLNMSVAASVCMYEIVRQRKY